jgi:N-acyl homoserine lactone hydrolase
MTRFILTAALLASTALAQTHKPAAPKSLRLYVIDCGSLNIPDTSAYQLRPEELVTKNMSVGCFLVVHPKGTLFWDAGAVPESQFKPGQPGMLRYAAAPKPLRDQLADIGYTPRDIQYVAFSHFHWDHIGNANLFAGSTWLARKEERDIMFGDPPSPRTEPQNFSALKDAKTKFIQGDYDAFGDGSVVLKPTPGHSPMHQVLFLKLKKTGPVVLSGDIYHYPEERKLGKIPVNEFNVEQTAKSRAELEAFLKRSGAQLWIQHDLTGFQKLKKSPQYYE